MHLAQVSTKVMRQVTNQAIDQDQIYDIKLVTEKARQKTMINAAEFSDIILYL
jgi:hypothetical protein